MKKVKVIFGAFAFLVAVTAAFAFTRPHSAPKQAATKGQDVLIWIKYDCSNPNQVQIVTGGNTQDGTVTSPFTCGDVGNVCAAKYLRDAQTELIPGQPNNRRPKTGVTLSNASAIAFCDQE